ncbi:MAG: LysR family transcriptional regulator [Francisellaceae bacterium]
MSLLNPQLLAFMAVYKQKTVHGAAEYIHLTQTAVTQRIKMLEQSLKTSLFIRTRRGMLPTQEGEALYRYCLAAKTLESQAIATISGTAIDTEVELVISAPTSMMSSRIIPNCLEVMKRFPKLLLHFDADDASDLHNKLRTGKADIAIVDQNSVIPEARYKPLLSEQYILVCNSQWRDRDLIEIIKHERIIDFDPQDQVTFNYLKQYHLFEFANSHRYFVNRTDNLVDLVAAGIGYTTLADEFALPHIKSNKLHVLNNHHTYNTSPVMIWFDRPEPPIYFRCLIDAIN